MYSKIGSACSEIVLLIFSSDAKLFIILIMLKKTDNPKDVLKSSFSAASNFSLDSLSNEEISSSNSSILSANLNS